MRDVIRRIATPRGKPLQLRIGVDAGPVVAGVIGRRKFSYDLWVDTVNSASRMESHGVPGRVQVTERVVQAAGEQFDFEARGAIDVKGKGKMVTFLLLRNRSSRECADSAEPVADDQPRP